MDSNSEYSISSIKDETREKFDAILKAAIRKKQSQSRELLVNSDADSTTASSDVLDRNPVPGLGDVPQGSPDNYILNKFLGGAGAVKPPVPLPRRNKAKNKPSSQLTFEVTSPKFAKTNEEVSSSTNKTYNIKEIGDVVVHQSPRTKIAVKTQEVVEKGEIETISDHTTVSSESDLKIAATNLKQIQNETNDEVIEMETFTTPKKEEKERATKESTAGNRYNYERIVEIIIHKTDKLELNSLVVHPVVKIHIIDSTTGEYFPKSDKARPVVFFYETTDIDYISPVITTAYNLQEKRTLYPAWNEKVMINEDYDYFLAESKRLMIFFEITDFVPISLIRQSTRKNDLAKGWHMIAFAFLKFSELNAGKKLRLQLYQCRHKSKNKNPRVFPIWDLWKTKKISKYPSTVYITVHKIISPTKVVANLRSKTPIQAERGSKCNFSHGENQESDNSPQNNLETPYNESKKDSNPWSRKEHESYQIPNKLLCKFDSYDEGCLCLKFSWNGQYLACGICSDQLFCIVVYSVVALKELLKFPCHQGLIYNIKWSKDDEFLITSSADNTVCIFKFKNNSLIQILPHPSFVYCCDISTNQVIVSGSYDGVIRIWKQSDRNRNNSYELVQELEGHHTGFITSVCLERKGNLFSSDSNGLIIEWELINKNNFVFKREIAFLELKNITINQLELLSNERKLAIKSRDSKIRIVDTKTGCLLQTLHGALNKRMQIFFAITPCSSYIFSGSENGFLHVWNSKSGREVANFTPYSPESPFLGIHCVDYHPLDNLLAICHYGEKFPILLHSFERDSNGNTMGTKENPIVSTHKSLIRKDSQKMDYKSVLRKMDSVVGQNP